MQILICKYENDSKRYTRATFQKTNSLSSWNHQNTREKLYRKRNETHSLKLKIIQHCKQQLSINTPDSPTDDMFRTPNTTIDADDSAIEDYSTPLADYSAMKMKSMNNLFDDTEMVCHGSMSRMKSMSQLEGEHGDTPVDLVKLKRDFTTKRFNNAKMQSLNNLANGADEADGTISKRHHSDNGPSPEPNHPRLSTLQPSRTYKRVGNTKYVGGESIDDGNYQLMKMKSMGTINDIVNNNMKNSKSFDPFWNVNRNSTGKKYDKTCVVPIRLEERFTEPNEKCDRIDDVFKVPDSPMVALRKEKSSSCIESMRNRGSSLYDRLR